MNIEILCERWPLAAPFTITGRTWIDVEVIVVRLREDGLVGVGEAAGVYYRNETPALMTAQIEAVRSQIEAGIDRSALTRLLPPGGARNAVDCALWDLQAQRLGQPAWQLAGLTAPPRPLLTTCTLGAGEPTTMASQARRFADARALKLKLLGDGADAARVRAVREARPDVWMGVDANQGFTHESFAAVLPVLVEARVSLIEQPFPVGRELHLGVLGSPIPIAADESVQHLRDMPALVGWFDMVNIKLDKCGGLTEALAMVRMARELGLKVMVGNMVGTSMAMAPAFIVGQHCAVVDLDGPLLLANDRERRVTYEGGYIHCADSVWGGGAPVPDASQAGSH